MKTEDACRLKNMKRYRTGESCISISLSSFVTICYATLRYKKALASASLRSSELPLRKQPAVAKEQMLTTRNRMASSIFDRMNYDVLCDENVTIIICVVQKTIF